MNIKCFSVVILTAIFTTTGLFTQTARADQPQMEKALASLERAKEELQHAERDKGGHRSNAVRLINQAIEEVNLGIDAGAHHG
jgi:hypothetical protein